MQPVAADMSQSKPALAFLHGIEERRSSGLPCAGYGACAAGQWITFAREWNSFSGDMLPASCCITLQRYQLPDVSFSGVSRPSKNAGSLPEPCPQHDAVLLPLELAPAGTESPVLIRDLII